MGSACLHVLALTLGVVALVRTRRNKVLNFLKMELNAIEGRAEVWRASTLGLRQQVEEAINRLESKRRSVAAVESRLTAREDSAEVQKAEAAVEEEARAGTQEDFVDRAAERRLRREQRGVGAA